jgi:hypothetical protein
MDDQEITIDYGLDSETSHMTHSTTSQQETPHDGTSLLIKGLLWVC